jgi:parvulin-like peptidyl-prolyl isomerase
MSSVISVNRDELFRHLKLSGQMSSLIEGLATCKIITAAATTAGITVEAEELQRGADNIRLANNLLQVDDTLEWLNKRCLSVDDFEKLAYINIISAKLAHYLFAEKIEPFFVNHSLDYAQVVLYEVILHDADLAMELFYALQAKETSFYEVSHQYVQDKELRRCGGYQGLRQRKALRPEISAAVFSVQPPQLLKPITTPQGTHLILVEEIIQPKLDEKLRQQILSDLFAHWIKEQFEQVEVITQIDASGTDTSETQLSSLEV